MFLVQELSQNLKVAVNPTHFNFVVPGNGTSEVFVGGSKLVFSNDAINAMFRECEVDLLAIEEPQIAGVSDEDIKDESQPTKFEDIVDENDVERSEDKVVENVEDIIS